MGNIFDIPECIRQLAQDGFDDIINEFGKLCTLEFKEIWQECTNCVFDFNTKRSANRYVDGGPYPFPNGSLCPLCGGQGQLKAVRPTETITMCVEADTTEWARYGLPEIRSPKGVLLSKGFIQDLPKVRSCVSMTVDSQSRQASVAGYGKYKYKLASEPLDIGTIVQGRYFMALWERT